MYLVILGAASCVTGFVVTLTTENHLYPSTRLGQSYIFPDQQAFSQLSSFLSRSLAYTRAKPPLGPHHCFNVIRHRDVSLLNHSLYPASGRANGSASLLIREKTERYILNHVSRNGDDMKILSRWKNSISIPSFFHLVIS
ncbi:hypothetical protein OG21DRAFT_105375 [Imleria badia]|nr:hypothetical protein OG21DRAFT_105375 [Imleria badia]